MTTEAGKSSVLDKVSHMIQQVKISNDLEGTVGLLTHWNSLVTHGIKKLSGS